VTDAPRWAAVVVNFESGLLLRDCVASLLADDSAGPVELVVVDNGSQDDSVATLRGAFPGVAVVAAPGNVGYARAANLGIAATRAPVVAVCNPDLELAPGSAAAVLARLDAEPGTAAVGPRVVNPDGSVYPSARRLPGLAVAVGHGSLGLFWRDNPFTVRYHERDADPGRARPVDWVSGAAVWLRRCALDAVGGWDEEFFMYFEDVDLCRRLRAAGWGVAYEPAAQVVHVQGAVTRRHPYRMIREHHRSAYRYARKTLRGPRSPLRPVAAAYLSARAGVAMAAHAVGDARHRGGPG